jgi:hypothetical protein
VLRTALAEPDRLAIGVDHAASMRASARRAERRETLPNALFVVSAVETLPDELDGLADRVTVTFPWGSLLQGLFEPNGPVLDAIGRISAPGSSIRAIWSVTPSDGVSHLNDPSVVENALRLSGFDVQPVRRATPEEIREAHSSWAKRLGAGRQRPAYIARATRTRPSAPPDGPRA